MQRNIEVIFNDLCLITSSSLPILETSTIKGTQFMKIPNKEKLLYLKILATQHIALQSMLPLSLSTQVMKEKKVDNDFSSCIQYLCVQQMKMKSVAGWTEVKSLIQTFCYDLQSIVDIICWIICLIIIYQFSFLSYRRWHH